MFAMLWISAALGISPAQRFAETHPASSRVASTDGQVLVHASGFLTAGHGDTPERAARGFLSTHAAAFGIAAAQELVLRQAPMAGQAGAVRFERRVGGLPVFGGDVVVGVDDQSRVFLVNTREVGAAVSSRHALDSASAVGAALSSVPAEARGVEPVAVAAGWRTAGALLRAVYRVDLIVEQPSGSWRVFVDAETGRPLFREKLRYSVTTAPGKVFGISPAETADSLCPVSGTAHTLCANAVTVTFPNLVTGADLKGTQTEVFNCKGADFPTAANFPGACTSVSAIAGGFSFDPDLTFVSKTDDFAAAMAYFHLDKHVTFFKTLDATLPAGPGRAVRGVLPAAVNSFAGGAAFDNAFYDSGADAMVFGQGTTADFAYDGTVMYHEFTHGVVSAWGGYNLDIDASGALFEPASLNEGTADSMAVSETGTSALGAFLAAEETPPTAAFRDMDDPNAARTCQGDGTQVKQFGTTTINGLSGEEHFDGEIWNGFYWEVFQGLRAGGWKACNGACDAGPAIQYKTLQLAAGTSPTFDSYWRTFKAASAALFSSRPEVAAYVDCVAKRRKLDKCDRTVPVYAGETKVQLVELRYSAFQMVIPAISNAQFIACSNRNAFTTLYGRKDLPVQLTVPVDQNTGNSTHVTADFTIGILQCSSTTLPVTFPSAGNWHLLIDMPQAFTGPGPGSELYLVAAGPSTSLVAPRPAATNAVSCDPPRSFAITAPANLVPPRGHLALGTVGGTGAALVWSFAANKSGGTIDASSGAYTAGPTGDVADTVKVTDSSAGSATRNIEVTSGVSITPPDASVAARGTFHFNATGGSGNGFAWSLATNASGGSIDAATANYTAGGTGNVTDVVKVTDALGNTANAIVTVTSSGGGGCASSGASGIPAVAAMVAMLLLRRRRRTGYL